MTRKTPEQDTRFKREDIVDGRDTDEVTGQSKTRKQKAIYGQDSYDDLGWPDNSSSDSSPWFNG